MTEPLDADTPFHVSKEEALCPLCGAKLPLTNPKTAPPKVLQILAQHFGTDCPGTAHVLMAEAEQNPRPRVHDRDN